MKTGLVVPLTTWSGVARTWKVEVNWKTGLPVSGQTGGFCPVPGGYSWRTPVPAGYSWRFAPSFAPVPGGYWMDEKSCRLLSGVVDTCCNAARAHRVIEAFILLRVW